LQRHGIPVNDIGGARGHTRPKSCGASLAEPPRCQSARGACLGSCAMPSRFRPRAVTGLRLAGLLLYGIRAGVKLVLL
jgi:hypothetical protein